jgi:hypothetical protein
LREKNSFFFHDIQQRLLQFEKISERLAEKKVDAFEAFIFYPTTPFIKVKKRMLKGLKCYP